MGREVDFGSVEDVKRLLMYSAKRDEIKRR